MILSPVHFPSLILPRSRKHFLPQSSARISYAYQRGTWALVYGLLAIAASINKQELAVWFPDYFCAEPLEVLKRFPITIVWYPVTVDLQPDWERIDAMRRTVSVDAFVLVHYFGFPNDLGRAQIFCRDHGIALVEDCAHVPRPVGPMGNTGIISVFSPWKFFPVPDGGTLSVDVSLSTHVRAFSSVGRWGSTLRWFLKRQTQRVLSGIGTNWYDHRQQSLKAREGVSATVVEDPSPTRWSAAMARRYEEGDGGIASTRRAHFQSLTDSFQDVPWVRPLWTQLPDDVVPLAFPLRCDHPAQSIVEALVHEGIPAICWPKLPELISKNPSGSTAVVWLSTHLLLLPIHQHITVRQRDYMVTIVRAICST